MENGFHNVIGIVVGQASANIYFVWCKKNQPRRDVLLTVHPTKPVSIASWISMRLSQVDFEKLGRQQVNVFDYVVVPAGYKTTPHSRTVQVELRQHLSESQQQLNHPLFGKIYNDMNLNFPGGLYDITIRRVLPKSPMESVWVLANVVPVPPNHEIEIYGIVAGYGPHFWYVFAKECPPALWITIPNVPTIRIGTWLQLTVPREQLRGSGELRCIKYTVYPDDHETNVSGNMVFMKLECWVPAGTQNVHHPLVGEIQNQNSVKFGKNGKYSIQIYTHVEDFCRRRNPVGKMWILRTAKLLEESEPSPGTRQSLVDQFRTQAVVQPVQNHQGPEDALRKLSLRVGQERSQFPLPLQQPEQQQRARSKSYHRSKSRKRNKTPAPAPRHVPETFYQGPPVVLNVRPQEPQFPLVLQQQPQQQQQQRARSKSYHRSKSRNREKTPLPTPRRSLESPQGGPSTANPSIFCKAMILNIVKKEESREDIFVWIFEKKEVGQLRLSVAAEKLHLDPGKTFYATFAQRERNNKYSTYGPPENIKDDEYKTRLNQSGVLEIQVNGKALGSPDEEHYHFPWIAHDDFGDILDNHTKLQHHVGLLYTFWIKRGRVSSDNFEWVVVEQDLTRRDHH